jgi:hypothetical protein
MNTQRKAGRYGKLEPVRPKSLRALAVYLAPGLPDPPASVDHTAGVTDWGLLGNDRYGDCTWCGAVHQRQAVAHMLGETWQPVDENSVIDGYLAYNHGRDDGCVESDLLTYWHDDGILGDKLVGFAPVDVDDTTLLKQAIYLFGAAYVGVQIPACAPQQFEAGQVWDLTGTPADDQIEGGHCVTVPTYSADASASEAPYWLCVTWGATQEITEAWRARYLDEAWALVTSEFLRANPDVVDVEALEHDLSLI